MGKTTDMFGRWKFWVPVNLPFEAKTHAASRERNIELLILLSDFMMNFYVEKYSKVRISVECMKFLYKNVKKNKMKQVDILISKN